MHFSSSGHKMQDRAMTQDAPTTTFQCSHCTLIFKSKVYLFEHLNKVHGFDVSVALRDAGLQTGTSSNTDNDGNTSGNNLKCQHCDFKACSRDVLNEHERRCKNKSEDQNRMINAINSETPENKVTVISANQQKEAAAAKETSPVMSTSKTECTVNSTKDVKTYKRPWQTITKCFAAASGSDGNSPVKSDSTNRTLILEESPSGSRPNNSGVFKVTAKRMIDITRGSSDNYLLNDHLLISELGPQKLNGQAREPVSINVGKRTSKESSKAHSAKRARINEHEKVLYTSNEQPSGTAEISLEFSEDEEEKKANLVNGDTKSTKVYFCKHCDYSDVVISNAFSHYRTDHPYIRYNAVYIQDPSDESATFRCLECPIEFLSVADLKRHYMQNHPEAPDVLTTKSHELCWVFKCFVCPFITNALRALTEHYKEKHQTHKVDNSLMFCRYSASPDQVGSLQLNTCDKTLNLERPQGISLEGSPTPCKKVKNAPASIPPPASKETDVALYHCNNCKFCHKSVVVVYAHYQKTHPDETVTMDKIKRSASVVSHKTSQVTPVESSDTVKITEESLPQKITSDSPDKTEKTAELSQEKQLNQQNPKQAETKKVESAEDKSERKRSVRHTGEMPTGMDILSCISPEKLFYCQFCRFSSPNVKSVIGHHNAKHAADALTGIEQVVQYSAEVQKKKLQSNAETSVGGTPSDSKGSKPADECGEKGPGEDEAADASVTGINPYACAENLFYCHKCNYGSISIKGILNHQAIVHHNINSCRERVFEYTALIRDEIEKSKTEAKRLSFPTNLPLPILTDSDENVFFCHFCNYRQSTMSRVLRHCSKKHHGFVVGNEQIRLYTCMVLEQLKKSRLRTTADQEVNHASPEKRGSANEKTKKLVASQTQRTLRCHRCSYSTQYVGLLKKHIWRTHKASHSHKDILRMCFKHGSLESGYHCDLCVFSDKKATAVHKHYQEQHPGRRISLEYITSQLFAGADTLPHAKKKSQIKHTDGICGDDVTDGGQHPQRSGQHETKMYSCRACSFRGSSVSSITRHYRAVHPWSVKEDGSVLDVTSSKRTTANRPVEDLNDVVASFDTYQAPLESDDSSGSSNEAEMFKCHFCPARFHTKRGLKIHCGFKHPEVSHVFKCLHCSYVNTNYQGVLTHCHMKHPSLTTRADILHVNETHFPNINDCLKNKGPGLGFSGFMCKTCSQICATAEKLNRHCEKEHNETVENEAPNTLKPAPELSAVSRKILSKTHSSQGSVSKASFLRKNVYAVIKCQLCAYTCTTKTALSQHLRVRHRNASVSDAQDLLYKCALCSYSFRRKHLGTHYLRKHGKEGFLKYYVPLRNKVRGKPASASPESPQPANVSEAHRSSAATKDDRVLVYRCPVCPYVNASCHGTLTHCQMRHPDVIARADELETDNILPANMVRCTVGKGSNERGYMCKKCPQIHVSMKKLKIHHEKDHNPAEASEQAPDTKSETEKQLHRSSLGSELKALNNKTSAVSTTENSPQLDTPETCQSNTTSVESNKSLYKCHICSYAGGCRQYLRYHYKNTHRLDAFTRYKALERYNKRKCKPPKADFAESGPIKCKICPDLMFDSPQLLISHYSTFHSSDRLLDFTVLSQGSKNTTGIYICSLCKKQMNGIKNLCYHLDRHRERMKNKAADAKTKPSAVITTTPEAKSIGLCRKDELVTLETVEDLARWNVKPSETFTVPQSPLPSPSKPANSEELEVEQWENRHICKQCGREFMSLKGLRSHERGHAALAAIKNLNKLPASALKHNIEKYIIIKSWTTKPFHCSLCSYRTNLMGLCSSHFMKNHHDVLMDPDETDNQGEEDAQRTDTESPDSSEEEEESPEHDEEAENSLYLEPPDVQRQLNHYRLMTQAGAPSKENLEECRLPKDSLLHCEFCNFSTGHLSSIRRHYLNRHGRKIFRCKDCDFITGLRKTLEMHMEMVHSTFQSEPASQKDLCCPFCLYQTINKNNMIDHIVLHREERVAPVEVYRPKLSRYLQGIVLRCHKCTFTSGSTENLRLHMMKHNDVQPYKCRLCYFDCARLSDLEAHLSDKHQVLRNHELVGQVGHDQREVRDGRMPEEDKKPLPDLERHDGEDVKTEATVADCNEAPQKSQARNSAENYIITPVIREVFQRKWQDSKNRNEGNAAKTSVSNLQFEKAKPSTAVQTRLRGGEDSVSFRQHEEERTLNIRAKVEDDEDGSIPKIQGAADEDRGVKMEQAQVVNKAVSEIPFLDQEGGTTATYNQNLNTEAASVKKNHRWANEIRQKENLEVSFTHCKDEQVHNQKNGGEVTDSFEEMPVLENVYLKEEMCRAGYGKKGDQSDRFKQKQDRKDEIISEDDEKQAADQEDGGSKETENPRVTKGLPAVTGDVVEVVYPAVEKLFICQYCGRNLTNQSELERHVMRHGL